jgi:hypothetical protein
VCDLETSTEEAKNPLKGCEYKPTKGCDAEKKEVYGSAYSLCEHWIQDLQKNNTIKTELEDRGRENQRRSKEQTGICQRTQTSLVKHSVKNNHKEHKDIMQKRTYL